MHQEEVYWCLVVKRATETFAGYLTGWSEALVGLERVAAVVAAVVVAYATAAARLQSVGKGKLTLHRDSDLK